MFKLIVFVALLSLAAARPSLLGPAIVHDHVLTHIPTAISHQSHVQIHSSPVVTSVWDPVLVHAPLVHSHLVHGPLVHSPLWLH